MRDGGEPLYALPARSSVSAAMNDQCRVMAGHTRRYAPIFASMLRRIRQTGIFAAYSIRYARDGANLRGPHHRAGEREFALIRYSTI